VAFSVNDDIGLSCANDAVLPRCLSYTLPSDLDIGWFDFIGDRISACHNSSLRRRSGACERVQHGIPRKREELDEPVRQLNRVWGGMPVARGSAPQVRPDRALPQLHLFPRQHRKRLL
jgi:hypothetical protein